LRTRIFCLVCVVNCGARSSFSFAAASATIYCVVTLALFLSEGHVRSNVPVSAIGYRTKTTRTIMSRNMAFTTPHRAVRYSVVIDLRFAKRDRLGHGNKFVDKRKNIGITRTCVSPACDVYQTRQVLNRVGMRSIHNSVEKIVGNKDPAGGHVQDRVVTKVVQCTSETCLPV